jgi:aldose 1-epimerase
MADYITPVDEGLIPTGEFMDVTATPFDFREMTKIGARIDEQHPQLVAGGGYDHNFVLGMEVSPQPELAAILYSPESGRKVEFLTTEPGIQVYTGNFMNGTITGKNGKAYNYRHAAALETQHFPDSPNQPAFPSTLLVPGEKYTQTTKLRIGVKD